MRSAFVALVSFCCATFRLFASIEPISVETRIDSATIYPYGALVERLGELALPAGISQIQIDGLPETLLTETVQVSGHGAQLVNMLDVRVVSRFHSETTDERRLALEEKMQSLEDQLKVLSDDADIVTESRRYIQSIRVYQTTQRSEDGELVKRPSIDEWRENIRFQEEALATLNTRQRELDRKTRKLKMEQVALKQEIAHLDSSESSETKSVLVNLETPNPTSFTIELSYLIDDASWGPVYDVRADTKRKSLTVVSKASVRQSSSENWDDVELTLSTASPDLDSEIPSLSPWRLSLRSAEDIRRKSELLQYTTATEIGGMSGNFANVAAPSDKLAEFLSSEESSTIAATEFVLPYRVSLTSDADPQLVAIKSFTVECDIYHWAMPKASETTYLKARAMNASASPLLPGSSQVYVDGSFVAASEVPLLLPGAEMNVLLGPSSRFSVKRSLVNSFEETVGLGGKNIRITKEFNFALESFDSEPQLLVLRDQIPISSNEDIVVKLLEPTSEEVEIDNYGMLIWRVTLDPKEKRDLKLKFSIQYPKGSLIEGL